MPRLHPRRQEKVDCYFIFGGVIFANAVGESNGNLEEGSRTFKESWIK